jgi:hypothetical protein
MIRTFGDAALAIFWLLIAGIVSANVRVWAAAIGLDQFLLRVWLAFPAWLRNMLATLSAPLTGWTSLRQLWWLWLVLGLSGGLGTALKVLDGEEPSAILRLDDGKRYRFIAYFQDQRLLPDNRPLDRCDAAVSIKPESKSAFALWDELRPLLSYGIWHQFAGGPGDSLYPNGLTVFTVAREDAKFVCASRLVQWINTQTPIKAELVQQATPILEQCKNECIEIHVGDGVAR